LQHNRGAPRWTRKRCCTGAISTLLGEKSKRSSSMAAYYLAVLLHSYEVLYTLAARLAGRMPDEASTACMRLIRLRTGGAKARALLALDKLHLALVRVETPRDKGQRERLRHLLEGVTVTTRGRRRRSRGLVERLGGQKAAPWLYLVPKTRIQELEKTVKEHGGGASIVYDPATTAITVKHQSIATR